MAEVVVEGISVCTDCAALIANGETGQGEEVDAHIAAGQVAMWGNDARWLVLTSSEEHFSNFHCEGCDSPLAGDRMTAAVIR